MPGAKTYPLFAVPLTIVNFGEEAKELNDKLIRDAFEEFDENPEPAGRSAIDGWQSFTGLESKYYSYDMLREAIRNCIHSILPSYGFNVESFDIFDCNSLWVNILTQRSAYHVPHIHGTGDTLFSGVYYPTSGLTPDRKEYYENDGWSDIELRASSVPESGDLVIFDPASTEKRQVIPDYVNRYPYYGSEICIRPKQSHLVIFPNYLSHMVAPVSKDNFHRMSISFSFGKK